MIKALPTFENTDQKNYDLAEYFIKERFTRDIEKVVNFLLEEDESRQIVNNLAGERDNRLCYCTQGTIGIKLLGMSPYILYPEMNSGIAGVVQMGLNFNIPLVREQRSVKYDFILPLPQVDFGLTTFETRRRVEGYILDRHLTYKDGRWYISTKAKAKRAAVINRIMNGQHVSIQELNDFGLKFYQIARILQETYVL